MAQMFVEVKDNPRVTNIGTPESNAVIIHSGLGAGVYVQYEIARRDGQPIKGNHLNPKGRAEQTNIVLSSWANASDYHDVLSISSRALQITLPLRQKYKVRRRWRQNVTSIWGNWTSWVNFQTRDTTYTTPNSITQEDIADDNNPTAKGNKRIIVTNRSKSSVTRTARGATVINSDTGYNGTSSVTKTPGGARVVNENFYNAQRVVTKSGRVITLA